MASEAQHAGGGFRWRPRQVVTLLTRSAREWSEDKAPRHAAALAYYSVFAMGPVLLIAVSVAGLAFGAEGARSAVTSQVERLLGHEAARGLDGLMESQLQSQAGWGLVLGVAFLLLSAGAVFSQLRLSMDAVWEIEPKPVRGIGRKAAEAVRRNLLGIAAVLGFGFLLLVSLAVSAAVSAASGAGSDLLPGGPLLWRALHLGLSVAVVGAMFAALFRFLPDARVRWRDVLFGAGVTAVLFVVGEYAIGAYLGQTATASRYGAAGAVIVLLLWVYYSSLILLYGAELTQVYANLHGGHVRPKPRAEPIQQAVALRQDLPSREGTGPARAHEGG